MSSGDDSSDGSDSDYCDEDGGRVSAGAGPDIVPFSRSDAPAADPASRRARVPRLGAAAASSSSSNGGGTKRATIDECKTAIAFVKDVRGRKLLTDEERLDIIRLQAAMRIRSNEQKQRSQSRVSPKLKAVVKNYTGNAAEEVHKLIGRSEKVVKQVWSEYLVTGKLKRNTAPGHGNFTARTNMAIPNTAAVVTQVHAFVRGLREQGTRVVSKHVLHHLLETGVVSLGDGDEETRKRTLLRKMQTWLVAHGYRRGKGANKASVALRSDVEAHLDEYLVSMFDNRVAGGGGTARRIVYMDESYVHHHYRLHDDSVFDPNDEECMNNKGRRYCFIGAIIGPDYNVANAANRTDTQKSHWIGEVAESYVGGKDTVKKKKTRKRKQPGSTDSQAQMAPVVAVEEALTPAQVTETDDYHGMFKAPYFEGWVRRLCDVLTAKGLSNVDIVMDNAKYHKRVEESVPTASSRKAPMLAYCLKMGVAVTGSDTKPMVWKKIQTLWKLTPPRKRVDAIVESYGRGYKVVWSPPWHSCLNPIEFVWAQIKAPIGRAYDVNTSFADVDARLKQQFGRMATDGALIDGLIRKAVAEEEKMLEQRRAIDEAEDQQAAARVESVDVGGVTGSEAAAGHDGGADDDSDSDNSQAADEYDDD